MRKLASVQRIDTVSPIPGADMIEVVRVNGWDVVVKKGGFQAGDKCIYIEIDSFLPERSEFEFLRKTSFKTLYEKPGFRLKTMKLRGVVSSGLVLPVPENLQHLAVGEDVTDILGIVKYDPPIPAELEGLAKGAFPSFISKTDEERVQNLAAQYEEMKARGPYVWSEKLEGTSGTYYRYNQEFGACGRNTDWLDTEGNTFWELARRHQLEEKMKDLGGNIGLQGELIGPGIQGPNYYQLKEPEIRFFNAVDLNTRKRYTYQQFMLLTDELELPTVPILGIDPLPDTVEELLHMANGQSTLCDRPREGLVLRTLDYQHSFKAVSSLYLLKQKD